MKKEMLTSKIATEVATEKPLMETGAVVVDEFDTMMAEQIKELENFLEENTGNLLNCEFYGLHFYPNMNWHYANKDCKTIVIMSEDEDEYGSLEIDMDDIFSAGFEFCQEIMNVEYMNANEDLRMYVD